MLYDIVLIREYLKTLVGVLSVDNPGLRNPNHLSELKDFLSIVARLIAHDVQYRRQLKQARETLERENERLRHLVNTQAQQRKMAGTSNAIRQVRGREIPDCLHSRRNQAVGQFLGDVGGGREDGKTNLAPLDEGPHRLHGLDGATADSSAYPALVVVESRHDTQSVLGKTRIANESTAQVPGAYQHGLIGPIKAEGDAYGRADLIARRIRRGPSPGPRWRQNPCGPAWRLRPGPRRSRRW